MEPQLTAGDVIDGRFEVQMRVGAGGMSTVYRAQDRATGRWVALKVLRFHGVGEAKRFAREASLLAELKHPGIVRYVAHGAAAGGGDHYIAMEWLEGRPLSSRLRRGRLSLSESVAVARRAADALGAAHRIGFLHRDVKPSNLFLVGGATDDVRLIDFGVARRASGDGLDSGTDLTRTGALVGTTAYMAPEQAEGNRDIDARVDVYALGVVFYEMLTGRRAFRADTPGKTLAKILFEGLGAVSAVVDGVPDEIDELIRRMAARDARERPADGDAVVRELDAILTRIGVEGDRTDTEGSAGFLTNSEQRYVWALFLSERDASVTGGDVSVETEFVDEDATRRGGRARKLSERHARLVSLIKDHGGRPAFMTDGSVFASFPGVGAGSDALSQAARCALDVRATFPEVGQAMVGGPAVHEGPRPTGDIIARGANLLTVASAGAVVVEESALGLLEGRFHLATDESGVRLIGERAHEVAVPSVLGRPTPFVGRSRELSMLEAMLEECMSEPVARTAIVLGDAGVGKSRLRQEFLARVTRNADYVRVFFGRGDIVGAGSPFGLVGDVIRRAAGIASHEPLSTSRSKLRGRVARTLSADDPRHASLVEFLGEMIRVPFPDHASPTLTAARDDAVLMGDSIRQAWETFLEAESARHAVLLVLEDLHHGDRPSIGLVDAALRNLPDAPFMVLGLARPEVESRFPDLWSERYAQSIRLAPLTRRSRETLVQSVLGETLPAATRDLLVQRSDGNPLYLEELMRAVARGASDRMPASLIAMVQARLDTLGSDARRVLRAASVYGERFSLKGVSHLLGGGAAVRDARNVLESLERQELLTRRPMAGRGGDPVYGFRHDLVRDAAYAMLTDEDRRLAHLLAGEWLEGVGESNPVVLAEHFVRGGAEERACPWFLRAAELSLDGNDLADAAERACRGIEAGATGELRGRLGWVRAEALGWMGDYATAAEAGQAGLAHLEPGSVPWFHCVAEVCHALAQLGGLVDEIDRWLPALRAHVEDPEVALAQVLALSRIGFLLHLPGRVDLGNEMLDLAVERAEQGGDAMKRARPWALASSAMRAYYRGDLAAYVELSERACGDFIESRDRRRASAQRANTCVGYSQIGDYERAETALRENMAEAEQMGLPKVACISAQNLGYVLLEQGRFDEARKAAIRSREIASGLSVSHLQGLAHKCLGDVSLRVGALELAEQELERAARLLEPVPALHADSLVSLGQVHHQKGDHQEALALAMRATDIARGLGGHFELGPGEFQLAVLLAEVHYALGDREAAEETVRVARLRLMESADRISRPAWRASYLSRVRSNARLLRLAEAWNLFSGTGR